MAKMQTFAPVSEPNKAVVAKLTGQAATVWTALNQMDRPVTGPELNEFIEANCPFKTRQDSLRVTLYYLVVFKTKGLVTGTRETAKPAVSETDAAYDLAQA